MHGFQRPEGSQGPQVRTGASGNLSTHPRFLADYPTSPPLTPSSPLTQEHPFLIAHEGEHVDLALYFVNAGASLTTF